MGGYDLNGRYYDNEADALNAEMAQCAAIDTGIQGKKNKDIEFSIDALDTRLTILEQKIEEMQSQKQGASIPSD